MLIAKNKANLKYTYGNRHFWVEGYYVSTVGLNEGTIKEYIQEQESHDIALDKLSVKEYETPLRVRTLFLPYVFTELPNYQLGFRSLYLKHQI
jgi:hypothetical protein